MNDAETVWSGCAALLRDQVSSGVWSTSFQNVEPVGFDGQRLTLAFPSSVVRDRVHDRYLSLLRSSLAEIGLDGVDIVLQSAPAAAPTAPSFDELAVLRDDGSAHNRAHHEGGRRAGVPDDDVPADMPAAPDAPDTPAGGPLAAPQSGSTLNDRYTFDAFVTGNSNRFAAAASLRVAETPARSYNPLFVYGDAGLGKTHLLQAIGNYVIENYPNYRVRYVTSEQFLSEFVDSIRAGTNEAFKRRFRDIDVLLVDDIQFFEGKKETQEEFFHTFNHLHTSNRQIVLSSDRPPDAIPTLEDRLRTRFVMGLLTDIQPPDLETRLAILRKKAEDEVSPVPDEILEFIAASINDNNIRSLEGALTRITAWASLNDEVITIEQAADTLKDLVSEREARPITPQAILESTADYFGYTVEELIGRSRTRPLTTARHVGMYLFRELTDLSFPNIAKVFGGRDHTTVIHAVERIKVQMKERRQVFQQVTELIQQLKADG
ncbi:MAG: chromosomal replication initiator protein DnaA [Acidimicrobiales bacterium]|nr:chromosomal replication initiator protein DnaA [Acidimicrobiales bacterium]